MSARTRAIDEPLHQKGANGLLAEYFCAWRVAERTEAIGVAVRPAACVLRKIALSQQEKYRTELSEAQFVRATNQGVALGDHIVDHLFNTPENLGLPRTLTISDYRLDIVSTGHNTAKADSADIELRFLPNVGGPELILPISLKAYASTTTSLGSKAAVASLGRLFLGKHKLTRDEFVSRFSDDAREFLSLQDEFKTLAREFYSDSAEGRAFVESYFERKGTRKVNNPLRRKEVGDYFFRRRGFYPEHRFAELLARMFADGYRCVARDEKWDQFIAGMFFVLGMTDGILMLNAVAGANGVVTHVENSLLCTTHGRLKRALRHGVVVELISTKESGTLKVLVRDGDEVIDRLGLSIWKDSTIQFKLTT